MSWLSQTYKHPVSSKIANMDFLPEVEGNLNIKFGVNLE